MTTPSRPDSAGDADAGVPSYDRSEDSVETGTGSAEPAANQPAGEPAKENRSLPTLPATGTVGMADAQAASPARLTREAAHGGSGLVGSDAAAHEQGQRVDPPPAPESSGGGELGVADLTAPVPAEAGRKAGASNAQEVVGVVRPHAPDGEVSPT